MLAECWPTALLAPRPLTTVLADSFTSAIFAVVSLTTVRTLASDVGHRRGRCEMTGDGIEFHASHALRFRLVYCPAREPSIDVFARQPFHMGNPIGLPLILTQRHSLGSRYCLTRRVESTEVAYDC